MAGLYPIMYMVVTRPRSDVTAIISVSPTKVEDTVVTRPRSDVTAMNKDAPISEQKPSCNSS